MESMFKGQNSNKVNVQTSMEKVAQIFIGISFRKKSFFENFVKEKYS